MKNLAGDDGHVIFYLHLIVNYTHIITIILFNMDLSFKL